MPFNKLSKRINELRVRHGLSKARLAEYVGVSPSAMGNYEAGERTPDADVIIKLADCFGVSTDYLLGKTDSLKPDYVIVRETTGLDEKAIDSLANLGELSETVCFLVSHHEFKNLLEYIDLYATDDFFNQQIFDMKKLYENTSDDNMRKMLGDMISTWESLGHTPVTTASINMTIDRIANDYKTLYNTEKRPKEWISEDDLRSPFGREFDPPEAQ